MFATSANPRHAPAAWTEDLGGSEPRRRILLVRDALSTPPRFVFQEFDVCTAAGGREALLLAKTTLPDAVVLDVGAPHRDSGLFLRDLRSAQRTAHIPIVLLCPSCFVEATAVVLRGIDAVVHKPCSTARLMEVVRRVLRHCARGC